jgi:predicted Rossmann fold flavoprotein
MANRSPYDILIIGAGAAGLMAASAAARNADPSTHIAALDGAKIIGAKILVSGGGRCNVTHHTVTNKDFAGSKPNQIAKVLKTFTPDDTIAFFADLGVTLKREDTGKLFPTTNKARTILDALLKSVKQTNATILNDHRVTKVSPSDTGFTLRTPHGELHTKKLILATGGKSLPKTGSDGLAYGFAISLGHTLTQTTPALVPLVLTDGHWLTRLSGLTADVQLTLTAPTGKIIHRQPGSLLLTHFGLSGPAAMDISRHWIAAHNKDPDTQLLINFLPDKTPDQLESELVTLTESHGAAGITTTLHNYTQKRLAHTLVAEGARVDPTTPLAQLTKPQRRAVVNALTALPVPIARDRGYLFAEVTAGGVPLSEINLATMESRTRPGLYLCGEILDVDGRIGGFNFQWAWASGRLAGISAAKQD